MEKSSERTDKIKKTRGVVIDTNLFLYMVEHRVDVIEEAKTFGNVFTIEAVLKELEKISKKGKGRWKKNAKIALRIIKKRRIKLLHNSSLEKKLSVDKKLLKLVDKGFIIATNDRKLIKNIKEKLGRVLRVRQRKKIDVF